MDQMLPRAKIPLRGLHGRMSQQQLNLLKFAATGAAQLGAGATTIVGCNSGDTCGLCVRLHELPDDLLAQAVANDAVRAIHGAENATLHHTRRSDPGVDGHFYPRWHRRRADSPVLTY